MTSKDIFDRITASFRQCELGQYMDRLVRRASKSLRRFIPPFILHTALAVSLTGCGVVSAELHDPSNLPSLAQDRQVHYEPGAESYAQTVAAMLPSAVKKVEVAQGRPFGRPFVVTTYASDKTYAEANGSGSGKPMAMTFFDRISLSPRLWRDHPSWLEADLVVELSHEHLLGNLSTLQYYRLPIWFVEGLGVMVSADGASQLVSARVAQRAICAGDTIEITDTPSLFRNLSLMPVSGGNAPADQRYAMQMAYRQSGLFVTYLRDTNGKDFKSLLDYLYAGKPFKVVFAASYGVPLMDKWQDFIHSTADACRVDKF